jgi:hypothetical protein
VDLLLIPITFGLITSEWVIIRMRSTLSHLTPPSNVDLLFLNPVFMLPNSKMIHVVDIHGVLFDITASGPPGADINLQYVKRSIKSFNAGFKVRYCEVTR